MSWEADVLRLRDQGYSWSKVAQEIRKIHGFAERSDLQLRDMCREATRKRDRANKETYTPKHTYSNGMVESTLVHELWDESDLSPEAILTFHRLDPNQWTLVTYTTNVWNAMAGKAKGNATVQMYQSKVNAKPKADGLTFNDIENWFNNHEWTKPPVIPMQYDLSGESLEICVPDLHTGLLAWAKETGASYDVHIARDAFLKCIQDIVDRCKGKQFKRIYVATLGDLLHTDNDNQTTTKGTLQQVDGRTTRVFDYALDMLITALDMLGSIAPTEVIYLSGNHDRLTGYMLVKALEMAYRRDTNYAFDVMPDPQKHRLIGCSLVGWTHGDMARKNMGSWLQDRARKEYGLSRFAEVHAGHLHSESTRENYHSDETVSNQGGIVVRHLPTISNSSFWEHKEGYPFGNKTMMCFVWHEENGLRDMWFSNL